MCIFLINTKVESHEIPVSCPGNLYPYAERSVGASISRTDFSLQPELPSKLPQSTKYSRCDK